jgi:hypothetical protein
MCAARAGHAQVVPLGAEFQIPEVTTFNASSPAIAGDASGAFVVAFGVNIAQDSLGDIFARRFDKDGQPLGASFLVNTDTSDIQRGPAVSSAPNGDFVVVWQGFGVDDTDYGVFGQRFQSDGTRMGSQFRVNEIATGIQSIASVSNDPEGGFVVVWEHLDTPTSTPFVHGQRFDKVGARLGSTFSVGSGGALKQREPVVRSDSSGAFTVAWENYSPSFDIDVFAQRFDSGGSPVGPEFVVHANTVDSQRRPRLAVQPDGAFLVTWFDFRPNHVGLYGQNFDSNGAKSGAEFRVSSRTDFADAASAGPGEFALAWSQDYLTGDLDDVFVRRYDPSGRALGGTLRANADPQGQQTNPVACGLSNGRYLVVWSDPDTDPTKLVGRRFMVAPPGTVLDGPPLLEVAVLAVLAVLSALGIARNRFHGPPKRRP